MSEETVRREYYLYEDEIDLRKYAEVLLRYWPWVVGCALAAAIAAFAVTSMMPPTYEAEAGVAIVRIRTDVRFEPRIDTVTGEELTARDLDARRQALVALVSSSDVALSVLEEVADQLEPEERVVEGLMERVETSNQGDLITIKARHGVSTTAASIADAWARAYVQRVNSLYNVTAESGESVAAQVADANLAYREAQQALERFLAGNRIAEIERETAFKQNLLDVYEEARTSAQSRPVTLELAELEREIAAKEQLLEVYEEAWRGVQSEPVDLQLQTRRQTLSDYYGDLQSIERWLSDARALRAQVATGAGSEAANMGNALALISLRNRALGGEGGLVELQVSLGTGVTPVVQTGDVEALIDVLTGRRAETLEEIQLLTKALLTEGPEEAAMGPDSPLGRRIADLAQEIKELSAELARGEPQLVVRVEEGGLGGQVAALNSEILALEAELEAQQAEERELRKRRDNVWETYQALAQKEAELDVQAQIPGTQVRVAAAAVAPRRPTGTNRSTNTALAGMVGMMVGVGAVFTREWWREE